MKLITVAIVILALGIVLGLALRDTAFDRPASAIPTCPGPSSQCATPLVANRAFIIDRVVALTSLIDTDDGRVIASYPDLEVVGEPAAPTLNCDGTRTFLRNQFTNQVSLLDVDSGLILGVYDPPGGAEIQVFHFSCSRLDIVNAGLEVVTNRAAISWTSPLTLLIDTDTGTVITSYPAQLPEFNCTGERLLVERPVPPPTDHVQDLVDSVTGVVIRDSIAAAAGHFACTSPTASP